VKIVHQIEAFLKADKDKYFTIAEIAPHITGTKSTVKRTLHLMYERGQLDKERRYEEAIRGGVPVAYKWLSDYQRKERNKFKKGNKAHKLRKLEQETRGQRAVSLALRRKEKGAIESMRW